MHTTTNMGHWKGTTYCVGRLLDHPEIMSEGRTVKELAANLREAHLLMAMDDVPQR